MPQFEVEIFGETNFKKTIQVNADSIELAKEYVMDNYKFEHPDVIDSETYIGITGCKELTKEVVDA